MLIRRIGARRGMAVLALLCGDRRNIQIEVSFGDVAASDAIDADERHLKLRSVGHRPSPHEASDDSIVDSPKLFNGAGVVGGGLVKWFVGASLRHDRP